MFAMISVYTFIIAPLLAAGHAPNERRVRTFDWHAGESVSFRESLQVESECDVAGANIRRKNAVPGRRLTVDEMTEDDTIQTLWDRPGWRDKRFGLVHSEGEHPCFAGFKSMIENTNRCDGFVRKYPPVDSVVAFHSPIAQEMRNFTLKGVIADNINVWAGPKSTPHQVDVALKAANIYANTYDIAELRPSPESRSWMEHECKVFGSMPFMYTCSNRINMLLIECGFENAFVMSGDYLRNFPDAANNESVTNHDIVFYFCMSMLDANPNPYAAANTFAHELAHVIQGGFGHTFNTMTEGGATWLEGALLHLPPRPIVYAWGFRDWNDLNAAHIYANTKELNSRKFYQIHAMFLTYLMQPELLGKTFTSALQNYATFGFDDQPWGRSAYDYFLGRMGQPLPDGLETVDLDVDSTDYPFAEALLNYRVAIVSACIKDPMLRPTQPKYLLPPHVRDRPYWDCSSYPTYWSSGVEHVVHDARRGMHYGGAAVFRLALPQGANVSVFQDADPFVRTKVLAAGDGHGNLAEVRELRPGEHVKFDGYAREIFIVQVNVDPKGETISSHEVASLWQSKLGKGWTFSATEPDKEYPPGSVQGLLSPAIDLPGNGPIFVEFDAEWDMEAESIDGSTVFAKCPAKGYDGVQFRVHVQAASATEDNRIEVVRPVGGYGKGPNGEAALHAFQSEGVYSSTSPCSDFEGWTGKGERQSQKINLETFAGSTVRLELLFVSDGSGGGKGFTAERIMLKGSLEMHLDEAMSVRAYVKSPPPAGTAGPITGVPVVVGYPKGYAPDRALVKNAVLREAPWSATWSENPNDAKATLRHEHLGWSYNASAEDTKDAFLHPGQEACILLKAPFTGHPDTVTLFTLVDKIGVDAVSLTIRSPEKPYGPMIGYAALLSSSWEVEDPGMHRFDLNPGGPLPQGTPFLACVGVGSTRFLVADVGLEPFLHLPLTEVPSAGVEGEIGATFLLTPVNGTTSGLDPWEGRSVTLRIEFVEAPHMDDSAKGPTPSTMKLPKQMPRLQDKMVKQLAQIPKIPVKLQQVPKIPATLQQVPKSPQVPKVPAKLQQVPKIQAKLQHIPGQLQQVPKIPAKLQHIAAELPQVPPLLHVPSPQANPAPQPALQAVKGIEKLYSQRASSDIPMPSSFSAWYPVAGLVIGCLGLLGVKTTRRRSERISERDFVLIDCSSP